MKHAVARRLVAFKHTAVVDKSDQFGRRNLSSKVLTLFFFGLRIVVLVGVNVLEELIDLLDNVAVDTETGVLFLGNGHVWVGQVNLDLFLPLVWLFCVVSNFVATGPEWRRG